MEAVPIHIGLEAGFVDTQDKSRGIANDVASGASRNWVLVSVALQRWHVTAVTVTSNCATFSKCDLYKFFDGRLLDIWSNHHLEIMGIA